jgi:hypothetical protein
LGLGLLFVLCALPLEAWGQASVLSSVLVCVPNSTLSGSVAPCPASPIAAPAIVPGYVLAVSDYQNLLSYDGPIDTTEGNTLVLTCAGWVVASYVLCLCIGTVLRLIKRAV